MKLQKVKIKRGVHIRNKKIVKEGQAWSIDLIIAVVIFVLIISIVYTFINRPKNVSPDDLREEGKHIAIQLNTGPHDCDFITNNVIDREQLEICYEMNAEDRAAWKRAMNIRSNYCVYIQDQNGRVISVANKTGFGDGELEVGGVNCNELLP